MKSFKKILSVLLVVICVFGMLTTGAFAADQVLDSILGTDVTVEPDIDEQLYYGVHYEIDSISGVSVMYKPNPDIELVVPSKVEISGDFPLAIDYVCIAWRGEDGKLYYPGDQIIVTGKVTLYAVWEEKKDNDPHAIRAIKTGFQTFIRMIQSFLGVFKVLNTPADQLTTKPTAAPTTTKPLVSLTDPIG